MLTPFEGMDVLYPYGDTERVPINIHPDVRERLRRVLYQPEFRGAGYSAFINRACEIAETEIAHRRRRT